MKVAVYDKTGKEVSKVDATEKVFGLPWNADLVHQVVTSMETNARTNVAHTHDRGEQRGGGKKPWRQKGTGRARHGSRRSPIWRGGGVTHGPRNEKDFSRKVNKKMKAKALATILSAKMKGGEILFVESFDLKEPKTKIAKEIIKSLAKVSGFGPLVTKRKNAALVTTDKKTKAVEKSFSNFGNLKFDTVGNLNPVELLKYKFVVIENPKESISVLESRMDFSKKEKETAK